MLRFTLVLSPLLLLLGCPDDGPAKTDAGPIIHLDSGQSVRDTGPVTSADAGDIESAVQINEVAPVSGSARGGTRVRLRGVGFMPDSTVLVNGEPGLDLLTLNERIITFRTPPGTPGLAVIRVSNSLGNAEVSDAFTYYDPLELNSVEPNEGSILGGATLRIIGEGFSEQTAVLVGGRAVRGLQLIDGQTMEGVVPPTAEPGEVDVEVVNAFGRQVLRLAFNYYSPLQAGAVSPAGGAMAGGYEVSISGAGFTDDLQIHLGDIPCTEVVVSSASEAFCQAGASADAGAVALRLSSLRGEDAEPNAFIYISPSDTVSLQGVVPNSGPSMGNSRIHLVGAHLTASPVSVSVDGNPTAGALVEGEQVTTLAPRHGVGSVPVSISTGEGTSSLAQAYTYYEALAVTRLNPARGPVEGGTYVEVSGEGFAEGMLAFLGGVALQVDVISNTLFSFTAPAGSGGAAELRLEYQRQLLRSSDAYIYEAPLALAGVHPDRGAQAGGTYVTLTGAGFSKGQVSVNFGFQAASRIRVLNDNTLTLHSPPNLSGVYDVSISIDAEEAVQSNAFTYFDPGFMTGGTHGGDVEGAVNVTVLTPSMTGLVPKPGAMVWLGLDSETPYVGFTNGAGQVTLSGPEIFGPQTVNAIAQGCSANSIVEAESADVTLIVYCSGTPSPGGGGGGGPPRVFPRLKGCVYDFSKSLFDVSTLGPDERAFAKIEMTRRSLFSNPTPKATTWEIPVPNGGQPCQGGTGNCEVIYGTDLVYEEGGCFDFITMPGRYALMAWAGIINSRTQEVRELRQLGVRRGVTAVMGETHLGLDISLNYALDNNITITMPDAPGPIPGKRGPNKNRVTTYLNFGGEGGYPLGETDSDARVIVQRDLPDFPGEFLTFYGGAFTRLWEPDAVTGPACVSNGDCEGGQSCVNTNQGAQCAGTFEYTWPYSVALRDGVGNTQSGVTLDPIMPFPEIESPVNRGVLRNGTFRWKPATTGAPPSIYSVIVINLASGQRWDFSVPGNQRKFRLPRVPDIDHELAPEVPGPGVYLWALQAIYIPGFDYENWSLTDLNQMARRAWTMDVEYFTKNF
jgi:hypothetical protein